jgi:hypothetical protein
MIGACKMKTKTCNNSDGERGAALVMAIMVTALLMVGVAGLLLESSKNSQNVTDSTAEQEAYSAAESGIQCAVNVLRYKCTAAVSPCQVVPSPLLSTGLTDYNKANGMNYARALNRTTSNKPGDTSTVPRLSRWIPYDTDFPDRVKLGAPGTPYSVLNGAAFSLEVIDPDNTGSSISMTTTAKLYDHDLSDNYTRTYGTAPNQTIIRYTPATITNLNVSGGTPAAINLGTFTYTKTGTGAAIPALNRFEIDLGMSIPFNATRTIRGFIEMNASPYLIPPKIIFDSQTYDIHGSDIVLNILGAAMRQTGAQPYGYEVLMPLSGIPMNVSGTMSAPPPSRLLIKSTGYGPRGSRKQLESVIQSNYFNGLGAPATITMVGPPSTTSPATTFAFDPGNSNAMLYSGQDAAGGSSDIIPPIGVAYPMDTSTSDDLNLDAVLTAVGGKLTDNVIGVPSNVSSEMPSWLANPYAVDTSVKALYNVALNSADPSNPTGRYFASGTNPTTWGDNTTATGITFCDGDCTLGPADGGGILVVTGTLTLHGNFSFNGLIIVTGQGGVIRNGGGNGLIQGNLVIAPYVNSSIAGDVNPSHTAGFLAPQYHTQGGGNSTITYNSNNQLSGLTAISNVVLGVAEK